MIHVPRLITVLVGATIVMTQTAAAGPDAASDSQIDRRVRTCRADPDKDRSPFFWELLPGPQVRAMAGLQAKTPVDLSGVTIAEKTITEHGRNIKLYIVKPEKADGTLPVFMFFHGGVWIAGNFETHKRFVRDLVVGSGAAAVFVEYNPIPDAVYTTQIEENYAATAWVASHGAEIGVDATRLAVVGNSVGGNMVAVIALMAKDRGGPKISFQLLFYPATDADFESASYRTKEPYAAPLQASIDQLRGLPPTLIQTAGNDMLHDEGGAYGRKLGEAGVEVTSTRYVGQIHDFGLLNALHDGPSTQAALRQASEELKKYLQP